MRSVIKFFLGTSELRPQNRCVVGAVPRLKSDVKLDLRNCWSSAGGAHAE